MSKLRMTLNGSPVEVDVHESRYLSEVLRGELLHLRHDLHQDDLLGRTLVSDFLMEKDRLFAEITLDENEYRLYQQIHDSLAIKAPAPDLVIYLQAPTEVLINRIEERGIAYEQRIERGYLEQLNEVYSEFFLYYDGAPLLIVNASQIDLVHSDHDYLQLVDYLLDIRSGRHYFNPTFF